MLFIVQCDSKPICAVGAKGSSPGVFPWKSRHTHCTYSTTSYSMVSVQQGNTALYSTMQNMVASQSQASTKDFIRGFKEAEKVGEEASGLWIKWIFISHGCCWLTLRLDILKCKTCWCLHLTSQATLSCLSLAFSDTVLAVSLGITSLYIVDLTYHM